MKTTNKTVTAALAAIAMFAFAGPVLAQYKPTGDDGITASPKARAHLDERRARLNTAPATVASMPCPKCKDKSVNVRKAHFKGAEALAAGGVPTEKVARHLCAGCESTIQTVGFSKQTKHDVVIHKCTSCGAELASCCNTTKGSETATKGMEKNSVEIAPLK